LAIIGSLNHGFHRALHHGLNSKVDNAVGQGRSRILEQIYSASVPARDEFRIPKLSINDFRILLLLHDRRLRHDIRPVDTSEASPVSLIQRSTIKPVRAGQEVLPFRIDDHLFVEYCSFHNAARCDGDKMADDTLTC